MFRRSDPYKKTLEYILTSVLVDKHLIPHFLTCLLELSHPLPQLQDGEMKKEKAKRTILTVVLLGIGLFQKSSPEQVLTGRGNKDQLASVIHRQMVICHHKNPFPKVPELRGIETDKTDRLVKYHDKIAREDDQSRGKDTVLPSVIFAISPHPSTGLKGQEYSHPELEDASILLSETLIPGNNPTHDVLM